MLQELHLLAVCQPHKMLICSGGSRAISAQRRRWGGEITLAEKLIAMRHAMPNALHRTFDSAAVDGGFHQNASHGRPQVDPRPCPQLRVEIPRHAITVVTGVSGSGKSSLVLDTIAAQYRREHNGIFPSFTQRYLPKYGRPHVGLIHSLPPAIAIDRSKPSGRVRSTVDTQTDTYSLLRKIIDGTLAFVMHGISESKKTC